MVDNQLVVVAYKKQVVHSLRVEAWGNIRVVGYTRALASVEHIAVVMGHIQLAFAEHKRLPYNQLVVA